MLQVATSTFTEKCRKKSPQYYNLLRVSCLEEDFSGTTAPIWMPFGVRSGFGHSLPHTKGQPNRTTNSWEIALVILTGKMEKEGGIHRDSFSVLQLFCFIFTKRFLRNYCTDLDALWCVASWDQTLIWHQRASKSVQWFQRNCWWMWRANFNFEVPTTVVIGESQAGL